MEEVKEGEEIEEVIGMSRVCAVTSNFLLVTNDNPNLCTSVQFVLSVFYGYRNE